MAGGLEELARELFAPLGGVSIRRMFGGLGAFKNGLMFALISNETLYLKADDATKAPFEAEGREPFVPGGMKRRMEMPYWRVPDRLLDEPDEFAAWAEIAFGVAVSRREARDAKRKPKSRQAKAGAKAGKKSG